MSTLEKIKDKFEHGLEQTWESLREGWQQLQTRANKALTSFSPPSRKNNDSGELVSADENVFRHASRWSVLAAEVKDYDDKVTVRLEVPGMEPNDFDVQVSGATLYVSGEKRATQEQTKGSYHIMETAYGQFERAISLPAEVDESETTAKYRRGVLQITLPKITPAKRKRIVIEQ